MLFELMYCSHASDVFGDQDLSDLVKTSRHNNLIHNITGCLFFGNGKFVQIIEGEEQKIAQLYKNIQNDLRNDSVNLLHHNTILERYFKNWSLALCRNKEELDQIFLSEKFRDRGSSSSYAFYLSSLLSKEGLVL
ncbi:MAG: BLUF domain-containing protein [Bacteroidota bacterium]